MRIKSHTLLEKNSAQKYLGVLWGYNDDPEVNNFIQSKRSTTELAAPAKKILIYVQFWSAVVETWVYLGLVNDCGFLLLKKLEIVIE